MAMTVKKVSELSGVSIRTLHWYDEVGLLKPAYIGANNFRYYEEEQLLMLQQILLYRKLGFSLIDIQKVVNSNDFNKIKALQTHKRKLLEDMDRSKEIIHTIDKTINHLKGKVKMKEEEIFKGWYPDDPIQKKYEQQLIDEGKVTQKEIEAGREKYKNWTKEDWDKIHQKVDQRHKNLVKALEKGLDPNSLEVQEIVHEHYLWVKDDSKDMKKMFFAHADMFVTSPEWRKMFDAYHPKLAEYLGSAMKIFAEREL